jgi:hypothetical protein
MSTGKPTAGYISPQVNQKKQIFHQNHQDLQIPVTLHYYVVAEWSSLDAA